MRRIIIIVSIVLNSVAHAEEPKDIPKLLQDISVTIKAGGSEGSGVAFTRDDITFIWTAAHVIDGLRKTREVIDPKTGAKKTIIEFGDPKIVKTLIENGRTVGRIEIDTEVIRYSNFVHGHDLALLKVRKEGFITASTTFYEEKIIPKLGTRLYHVGSLLGQQGSNSMTAGIMSQHGRLINKNEYDQTTVTAFPGSSGGGVYLTNGQYVGMLVRGAGEGFNLVVPVRRMRLWAKQAKIEWAMDPTVDLPTTIELEKLPVEDSGKSFAGPLSKSTIESANFMIRITDEENSKPIPIPIRTPTADPLLPRIKSFKP
jgi:hypothetical protein